MRYGRYRFLLYKKWDYARNMRTEEQQEALDAGKALFKAANIEHWASQPDLVERAQKFLVDSFPSYRPSSYGESPKNVIDALCRELRNGDVVIVRAEPAYIAHDGFVPTREFDYEAYERDIAERASSYAARSKAYRDDLKAYNQEIDERIARESRALQKPFRHVETMAEAQARNIAARAASEGTSTLAAAVVSVVSAVASALPSLGDDDAFDLGDVTAIGGANTPLSNVAPFEFGDMPSFGDGFDIAKTPNNGEPGSWCTNPGSGQMRLYGNDGKGYVDLDFDHAHGGIKPHAHNWVDSNRDWAVVPFSPMPY
ncbi:hypothetical protein [Caballeronia sordidicola]|uniref:hypothetical protein n=1 Tax=Caballeronia sordidicola TaxID=196367 RepID=UPI001269B499|nr:hypothetical protein [Caballeronia sordidicola]